MSDLRCGSESLPLTSLTLTQFILLSNSHIQVDWDTFWGAFPEEMADVIEDGDKLNRLIAALEGGEARRVFHQHVRGILCMGRYGEVWVDEGGVGRYREV